MRANAFERLTRFISGTVEVYDARIMRGARTRLMSANAALRHAYFAQLRM